MEMAKKGGAELGARLRCQEFTLFRRRVLKTSNILSPLYRTAGSYLIPKTRFEDSTYLIPPTPLLLGIRGMGIEDEAGGLPTPWVTEPICKSVPCLPKSS